jgi:hypothetical protein
MLNFKDHLQEQIHKDAEKVLHDASYRSSIGDHSRQTRLKQMGFDVVSDSEQENEKVLHHSHFSKTEGKPLGKIPLPTKVIQSEVDKEKAKSLIDHYDKLPPIKVAKVNGEHIVVDGHHRLAVAKALGKKTIHATLVN